jgi:hypothetical protein
MWQRNSDWNTPLVAAVSTSEGQDLWAGRKRVGCPTGQTARSTGKPYRTLRWPPAKKIHSSAYEHETFFSILGSVHNAGA